MIRHTLTITCLAVLALILCAQAPLEGKKYALLIGVNEYHSGKLTKLNYAVKDVEVLAALLREHGYAVTLLRDKEATRDKIGTALDAITKGKGANDLLLVGMAGHGVYLEKHGSCYCPQDADFTSPETTLLSMTALLDRLGKCGAGTKLLLVDACRDDPARSQGIDHVPPVPLGVGVLLSCSAGQRSFEPDSLKHGLFFHSVLAGLRGEAKNNKGEITWDRLRTFVKENVPTDVETHVKGGKQLPHDIGNLTSVLPLFRFAKLAPKPLDVDLAKLAPKPLDIDLGSGISLKLAAIPAGNFLMGSPKDEKGRSANEFQHPVELSAFHMGIHEVTIGQFKRFVAAENYRTEAETDGQGGYGYNEAKKNPFEGRKPKYNWKSTGFKQDDDHPVVNVTWNDAKAFCAWLSKREGKNFGLPSEAQWEYVCRAKTTTAYHSGDDPETLAQVGNVADAAARAKFPNWTWTIKARDGHVFTASVGQFKKNDFGMFDMHGNVWEWCEDWYSEKYYENSPRKDPVNTSRENDRVVRGGSWNDVPQGCRCAYRPYLPPAYRSSNIGFRVVLRAP